MKKKYKLNILSFSFLMRVSFYTPIFAAFLSNVHNLTNSQITILFAVFSVTTFIFEIPTGIIGDMVGERFSLILGSLLATMSTMLFILGGIHLIFLGEIVLAISSTFMSGSFESLTYQYCRESEDDLNCEQFISRAYTLQWTALCFSFIGCFVFMKFMNLTQLFWITLFFNLCALIMALNLPTIIRNRSKNGLTLFVDCLREIVHMKHVRLIFIYNLMMTAILVSGYQILQPYLNELKIDSSYNGLLYFFGAFVASMGSEIFGKISSKISYKWIFNICTILLLFAMFGFSLSYANVLWVGILLCCYRFAWGLSSPLLVLLANQRLESDDFRNTFFSLSSLFSNLLSATLLFLFGAFGIKSYINYGILGSITTIFAVVVLLTWREPSNG